MQSIETLQREHRVVTLVADAARSNLLEERSGGGARVVEIDRFIDFFRHYTIACHHPQEEDLLFAAVLDARALPRKRAEDDRVFQPFAFVNGDQVDGLLVGLQP